MDSIKLNVEELRIGEALPWSVYDDNGRLLLQRGEMITSNHQLTILIEQGLYRKVIDVPGKADDAKKRYRPFESIAEYTLRLNNIFNGLLSQREGTENHIISLCEDLQNLCDDDADGTLAALHILTSLKYTLIHPIHIAILIHLVGKRLHFTHGRLLSVQAAALTCNIGMLELQETLQKQKDPMSIEQRQVVENHPDLSLQILEQSAVVDDLWLNVVHQHHERLNGEGYPQGLEGEEVIDESQILALADRYAAMITGRSYRDPIAGKEALRSLFVKKGQEFSQELCIAFIKELGVYPPGTYVRLVNGDVAIVYQRGQENNWPIVYSLVDRHGVSYITPIKRDCNEDTFSIKGAYIPDTQIRPNLQTLWGYD